MQRVTQSLSKSPWLAALATAASTIAVTQLQEDRGDEQLQDQQQPRSEPTSLNSYSFSPPYNVTMSEPFWKKKEESSAATNKRVSKRTLQRRRTIQRMSEYSTKTPLRHKFIWHKNRVLGEGSYGSVYLATEKKSGKKVALKQISKKHTNDVNFQQEMKAMLYIRSMGGHPHLCSLHEHYDLPKEYILILDYIGGGEMFDHLIQTGAYSELDASRLVQEVASALNFLHGIGIVHADLKPENILLTTSRRGDAVVKLADFGCTQLMENAITSRVNGGEEEYRPTYGAPTPAYCPPESILKTHPIQPPADMWGLGVILFIMLTGAHPYDLSGEATDDEIEERIKDTSYQIPLENPEVTGHLSASAKDVISKLMNRDPAKRLTAMQMLQHPWVRGETAATDIMTGSNDIAAKLSKFKKLKSKLQAKFFETAVMESDDADPGDIRRKTSLIERSFQALDADQQGYLSLTKELLGDEDNEDTSNAATTLSMSDFQNLLSTNIKHQHFPAGHIVYQEGDIGNHMYFIDSGTVEVQTESGSRAFRSQGDFFGEGALLHPKRIRSATVKCLTPVHALDISREYFEKYIALSGRGAGGSGGQLYLTLKEKDKIRKRNRAKSILRLQNNLKSVLVPKGSDFFKEGKEGDTLYILEKGRVELLVEGNHVLAATEGNIFGEHSVVSGRLRNCTAKCVSSKGCIAQEVKGHDFRKLLESSPHIRESLRELQLRREFKKAVVLRLQREFPYSRIEEAFAAAKRPELGLLDKESITGLMRELHPDYSDEEIEEVIKALDLTNTGNVTFDEFKKVFIGDKRTSASM